MVAKNWMLMMAVVLGAQSAFPCYASVNRPESYERLTAVVLQPGQAPRFVNGMSDLSVHEKRHREKLPMQLEGAMNKVKKKRKYSPGGVARDRPAGF